ncbi:RQC domain-containing protein [Halobacteriovorax sp. ZH5_bin.2]|uniref:RQC domain-containing protein n=1 Tax=unclassified Halobacteriovorax TaxID=2639665 RepID=UPI00372182AE
MDDLKGNISGVIQKNGHHHITSFGYASKGDQGFLYSLCRQLIAQGYLKMIMDGSSETKLTQSASMLLKIARKSGFVQTLKKVHLLRSRLRLKQKQQKRKRFARKPPQERKLSPHIDQMMELIKQCMRI